MEAQKTSNSQGNIEQKEQCWRYHNTSLQTILQSHNNKNSIGTGTKTKTKLDINPHKYSHLIFDKDAPNIWSVEKTASSMNVAEKTGYLHVEDSTRSRPFTLY
jgi:hypothetical protein